MLFDIRNANVDFNFKQTHVKLFYFFFCDLMECYLMQDTICIYFFIILNNNEIIDRFFFFYFYIYIGIIECLNEINKFIFHFDIASELVEDYLSSY